MTWALRRATTGDHDAIMAIETATFAPDDWSSQMMSAELGNPHTHYLVAHDEAGAIVGYAGLLAPIGTGQGDIQTIAVAPEARRHGLGRTLMLALLDEARRRGADEVFLEVRVDNPAAEALYHELGFEVIDTRKRYYRGGIDAHVMRLRVPEPRTTVAGA
ncbi:ribosomal protein S18-alanine N-acetyltransferase [soil metagenome]